VEAECLDDVGALEVVEVRVGGGGAFRRRGMESSGTGGDGTILGAAEDKVLKSGSGGNARPVKDKKS